MTKKNKKPATKFSQPVPKNKIKVLAYCDSPTCATGFGTVSRNILLGLYSTGRYDIDVLGINYWGDPHNLPFRIWPTGINSERDPYGRKKVFKMIQQMDFDIIFFLQDTFILDFLPELQKSLVDRGKPFKSIVYYPVDGVPKEQWLHNVNACDFPVAYSEFGKAESMRVLPIMKEPLVVPHGANTKDFFVADKKDVMSFRSQYFGNQADKFILCNLNRNQQRKDIPRTIAAFKEFKKQVPESLLYLHMAKQDQGWNLTDVCNSFELDITKDVIFPENFGPNQGYPRNIVNMIYNASDCVISTTLGEGWGLCLHGDSSVMTVSGQKRIKNIVVGDNVVIAGDAFPVNGVESSNHTQEFKIKLYNNQELVGSGNHKVPTCDDVYKNLSEISTNDWLLVDKAVLKDDAGYTYDLKSFADTHDDNFVWNKMGFSPSVECSIMAIMEATKETKKIIETAIKNYDTNTDSSSNRVNSVISYLESIWYKKTQPVKMNRYVEFDSDFARLLGYYVAEGSNESGNGIEFSFHTKETVYHEDVSTLIEKYFGVKTIIKIKDNRCAVRVRSSILAKFFGDLCGIGSHNKHIPLLCMQHRDKAKEFIKGAWRGDGHFGDVEFSYSTASIVLKEEMMWLLSGFNIFSKCNKNKVGNWAIYVNGKDYNLLAEVLDHTNSHDNYRERSYIKKHDNFFMVKVKSTSCEEINSTYYDISVDSKRHFVVNGIVVHNSWIEAMATKTPVIMPANTALVENITEDRGWLCKSGSDPSLFTVVPNDNEVIRPLVDVNDMVCQMLEVYNNPDEATRRAENAYNWIHAKMDWGSGVVPKWITVFDDAYNRLSDESNNTVDEGVSGNKVIDSEAF